jgi:AcrR family transcriptional regulator
MIANEMGLSKASIYNYFATKEDILIACGDSFLSEMLGISIDSAKKDSKNKTDILKFLNSNDVKSNFLCCMMAYRESSRILRKHIDSFLDCLLFSAKLPSSDISKLIGNKIWDSFNRSVKSKKE